jgi:uncharacterized damage-inducible protein DinB
MRSELQNYLDRIEDLRGQIAELVRDLPAEGLNWRPVDGIDDHATNSLAVMTTHVAGAEQFWIAEVVGGHPSTRDRDAEFKTEVNDSADLIRQLEQVGRKTRAVFGKLTKTDLAEPRPARDKVVSIRWALLHVVDHTALHLGQMQLTYQLWQGGRATNAPRWFQRLPDES